MKTEELTALGLTKEQIDSVFAMNGKDIEGHKKRAEKLEAQNKELASRLAASTEALEKLEGVDPEALKAEVKKYQDAAAEAERSYKRKLTERDQQDWLKGKLDEYGVGSPYARKQLMTEAMAEDTGLKWKDGAFYGFDDFMKAAKEKDSGLYQTEEEKKAAAEQKELEEKAPQIVAPVGQSAPAADKFVPPKIF
jgi:uncharacterized protein YhbP (UPF0306 family)